VGYNGRQPAGFTLLEVLLATFILGIVALAAIPSFTSSGGARLEVAASEVASAIRFARSEALRTGQPHGVYATTAAQRLQVYRLVEFLGIPVPTYDVRNPLDKQLYDLKFGTDPVLSGVTVVGAEFLYTGSTDGGGYLGFDPIGTPKYTSGGTVRMLVSASVELSYRGDCMVVKVQPMTGRVMIDD